MGDSKTLLEQMLHRRLEGRKAEWLEEAVAEVEGGVSETRFPGLLSLASRFVPRQHLAPSAGEIDRASRCLPGWNPERSGWREETSCGSDLAISPPRTIKGSATRSTASLWASA